MADLSQPDAPPKLGQHAVVLFSGGQDSTTCLYWALQRFETVEAVGFRYGQRHIVEMQQAQHIAQRAEVPYRVLEVPALEQLGQNALTDSSLAITTPSATAPDGAGLPNTFVPGRNLIFLGLAASAAYLAKTSHLVGGMCETDFSGYPDCRRGFLDSLEETLRLGLGAEVTIHTPLMWLNKAETWQLADNLGCLDVVIEDSHTCYNGDRAHRQAWGYGCGHCPACELRAAGYAEAFPDDVS